VCSIGLAATPFIALKLGHINVASYFLLPFALGLAVRWVSGKQSPLSVACVVVVGLLSPSWWIVVAGLVLGCCLGAAIVMARWTLMRSFGVALACVIPGALLQLGLEAHFSIDGLPATRGAWDSNEYGGHMSDFLLASPFWNGKLPFLDGLQEGSSVEPSRVGMLLAAAAAFAILAVVVRPKVERTVDLKTQEALQAVTSVVVLFFLLGGLGNLQAGAAVLLGAQSPARVWARLAILVALVGCGWGCAVLAEREWKDVSGRVFSGVLAFLGAAAIIADLSATRSKPALDAAGTQEAGAVSFISSRVRDCPIAQLPQDAFPVPRVLPADPRDWSLVYYRPFVPYLLAPDLYWSYASWSPTARNLLNDLPVELSAASLRQLRSDGFCAVLYDKQLADLAQQKSVALEGGLLAPDLPLPEYEDERYTVYLLD
jgi:hypothetical protein